MGKSVRSSDLVAPNTGGPFAWLDRFAAPLQAVTLLDQLTQKFGERYAPVKSTCHGREWWSLFRLGLSLRDAPHVQQQRASISSCSRKSSSEIESQHLEFARV